MCEALVEYDYIAQKSDELTIKKGDIIKEVVNKQLGWCEGVLNEKRGLFPDNYVKILDKDVVYRNKKDSTSLRQCKVVFSYQPIHPDELALCVGDVIDIIGEDEEGWWKGVQHGKEGVFPSNFVEEIFPTKPKVKAVSREDLSNIVNDAEPKIPNLPPKPARVLCIVKYAYKAQNEDELSLKEGDVISLLNQEIPDPGWWEGELNGKVGVFPDNFVVVIKQEDDKLPKDDLKHIKPTYDPPSMKPIAIVSQRTSLEPKTEPLENKPNPPLLKKPDLLKKISPSSVSKGFRGFVGSRKSDIVDGIGFSKSQQVKSEPKHEEKKEKNGENAFDHVERTPLLKDVRAGRAKPPIRRPPTSGVTKDKSPAFDSEEPASSEEEPPEAKPSVREWEKHKAPWLEEMKMNQAKRSSTSPISEKCLNTKGGLYPELDKSPVENVMSKSMPCPVTSKISPIEVVDSNKTPVPAGLAKSKAPNNLQNLTKSNYSNVELPASVSPNPANSKPSWNINKYKNTNSNEKPAEKQPTTNNTNDKPENNRIAGDSESQEPITITVQQYSKILERINRLEVLVDFQASAIEELRNKLYIERDKRKLIETQKL
ncbi:SH3 domain-containing protein [Oryctes borbonicus]|uniref:SH3 domain-containing protein n=1 Tax=Oryctes borbonicus TaxID=1629725 RepID=A0A0T6B3G8_9SCAR|nr:SH3 domain-containing protein [Oryctes borbonicus]